MTGEDLARSRGFVLGILAIQPGPGVSSVYEHVFFRGQARIMRDITIYLTLYSPVKVLEIGLADGTTIESAQPFAVAKPVVFYGTSITQGGCASRAGMSYQANPGRRLNLNHVNLGFSGNGLPAIG